MDKNELIAILKDWNFWDNDLPTGIFRDQYTTRINEYLSSNQVIALTGPRRAGKSYIMRQVVKSLIAGGVDRKSILFVNFEDPRFARLDTGLLQTIYEVYRHHTGSELGSAGRQGNPAGPGPNPVVSGAKSYIFLDEVQLVDKWEKWVRTFHELDKAKFIISGSNSELLHTDLASALTGRNLAVNIFPLSFREFLLFKEIDPAAADEMKLDSMILEYMESGGFPEVAKSAAKKEILLNYFANVLDNDLIKKYKIRKPEKMKNLARYYLSNQGTHITYRSLGKNLDLTTDTSEKFSTYLANAFLFGFLRRFSFKVKEQQKSSQKVYPIDTGLANAVGFRFSENIGRNAETIVYLHLLRQQAMNPGQELYYWKNTTHQEVDFVVKEGKQVKQLIQVCWDLSNIATQKREVTSLIRAMEELQVSDGIIISSNQRTEEKIKGHMIKFVPFRDWLRQ